MVKKLTMTAYRERVEKKFGKEYKISGVYQTNTSKLQFEHNCGHVYSKTAASFLASNGCIKCHKHKNFLNKVETKRGVDYTILGRYDGELAKVSIQHDFCGYIWDVAPKQFFANKFGCPHCAGVIRELTQEDIEHRVAEAIGDDYLVVGEYLDYRKKMGLRHQTCGEVFYMTPRAFLDNHNRCPKCTDMEKSQTKKETYQERMYAEKGADYIILSDYVNHAFKMEVMHMYCGHTWEVIPSEYFSQTGKCPLCDGYLEITPSVYRERVGESKGDEYTVLGDYKNKREHILVKHNTCQHEWLVNPSNFLHKGTGCPSCYVSHGEGLVASFLRRDEIPFELQKTFEGMVYKRKLRVDFYLADYNLVIEYDGRQHYEPVQFGGMSKEAAEFEYIETLKRDKIKNEYFSSNNVPLLRLPYYLSPEEIVQEIKSKLKSISQEVTQRDLHQIVGS